MSTTAPTATVVTAASERYWRTLWQFLRSAERTGLNARARVVVWNVGLTPTTEARLAKIFPWCAWRTFRFAEWPAHFEMSRGTYAWKPALMVATQQEFGPGLTLWLDCATVLKASLEPLFALIRQHGIIALRGQTALRERCDAGLAHTLGASEWVLAQPEFCGGVVGWDAGSSVGHSLITDWHQRLLSPELALPARPGIHQADQAVLSVLLLKEIEASRLSLPHLEIDISSGRPVTWLSTRNKVRNDVPTWLDPLCRLYYWSYKTVDQWLIRRRKG